MSTALLALPSSAAHGGASSSRAGHVPAFIGWRSAADFCKGLDQLDHEPGASFGM